MNLTEDFIRAFDSGIGTCRAICECGIVHFDEVQQHYDWEEGELEELQEFAKYNPEAYVAHDHSIGFIEIDNKQVVIDCSCNTVDKYEDFILNHVVQIAEYLNRRAKYMRQTADLIEVKNGGDFDALDDK